MPVSAVHGKNAAVFLGSWDLSQYFNSFDTSGSRDALDSTTFQPPANAKSFTPGLRSGTVTVSGFWTGTTTGIDAIVNSIESQSDPGANPALVFPGGGKTLGDPCYVAGGPITKFDIKSVLNGLVAISLDILPNVNEAAPVHGRGQSYIAVAASGNSGPIDFGAAQPNGGVAILFVDGTTRDAGSCSFTVQYSPDGSSWAAIGSAQVVTFGNVLGIALPLAAATARYIRLVYTVTAGTTGDYLASFGFGPY